MTTTTKTSREPELVEIPGRSVLMTDGRGDPNGSDAFQAAVGALYSVSYGLKFHLREALGLDRPVGPLEGLWWDDGGDFSYERREGWRWTLFIEQPEEATPELVETLAGAKGVSIPLRLERFAEGRVAQILHVGPFSDEPATIERLHAFIRERGLRLAGRHHEIYLSDLRRTSPERLRTVLRQPVTD
jgi:hypothetical protein